METNESLTVASALDPKICRIVATQQLQVGLMRDTER